MIEARMRCLADSFGGLGRATDVVPDVGQCLQIIGSQVLLHFPGASRQIQPPTRPAWTALLAHNTEAVLLLVVRTRPHPLNPWNFLHGPRMDG
ncbi:hypothetical protein AB0L75_08620 [Streptomyces sp. NPDC052101]|uniref:hypothetical protein n=1 Tax=Streptomyces sp. NPDC052101 TaxID=3155763 RepID=UPI00341C48D2